MTSFAPPGGFHFSVQLVDGRTSDGTNHGAGVLFQEVSGLEVSLTQDEVTEGGENRFVHRLPQAAKRPILTLKRGWLPVDHPMLAWVTQTVEGDFSKPIVVKTLKIALIDGDTTTMALWEAEGCYPTKWAAGPLNAAKSELAIETMEYAVQDCRRVF